MYNYFSLSSVTSTNDIAKKLLEGRKYVIVSANYQTNGRGRNNKRWLGDYGKNIFLSYGVIHIESIIDISQTMLAFQCIGCLAVKRMLDKIGPLHKFELKYPNDVYALHNSQWRKIAGILIENEFVGSKLISTIIGIGVNVSQIAFEPDLEATSLALLEINENNFYIIRVLIDEINNLLGTAPHEIINIWKKELKMGSKTIDIIGDSRKWEVEGFNEFGMLIVMNEGNVKIINDGDSIQYTLASSF